jgi:hypothetical protein
MKNRSKGADPEKAHRGTGRVVLLTRRQQCAARSGKRDTSTRGLGLIESEDNEHAVTMEILMRYEGRHSLAPSPNNEEWGVSIRKSEWPIRAEKSGNADGAMGPRYGIASRWQHAPTPSGLCA